MRKRQILIGLSFYYGSYCDLFRTKKTPGGEGERIEFHAQSMREGRPVLAGVGVNGLRRLPLVPSAHTAIICCAHLGNVV